MTSVLDKLVAAMDPIAKRFAAKEARDNKRKGVKGDGVVVNNNNGDGGDDNNNNSDGGDGVVVVNNNNGDGGDDDSDDDDDAGDDNNNSGDSSSSSDDDSSSSSDDDEGGGGSGDDSDDENAITLEDLQNGIFYTSQKTKSATSPTKKTTAAAAAQTRKRNSQKAYDEIQQELFDLKNMPFSTYKKKHHKDFTKGGKYFMKLTKEASKQLTEDFPYRQNKTPAATTQKPKPSTAAPATVSSGDDDDNDAVPTCATKPTLERLKLLEQVVFQLQTKLAEIQKKVGIASNASKAPETTKHVAVSANGSFYKLARNAKKHGTDDVLRGHIKAVRKACAKECDVSSGSSDGDAP